MPPGPSVAVTRFDELKKPFISETTQTYYCPNGKDISAFDKPILGQLTRRWNYRNVPKVAALRELRAIRLGGRLRQPKTNPEFEEMATVIGK